MDAMPLAEELAILEKVKDISDYRRLTPEQRAEYDYALKCCRDYNLILEAAREEGRRHVCVKIASRMKQLGYDYALIASVTELTLAEIAEA